jgi:CBS-domain-containing membrane protein
MQELHDISMAKIDTLSEAIAEVIESNNEILDVQFSDHEQHITKLEQKAV